MPKFLLLPLALLLLNCNGAHNSSQSSTNQDQAMQNEENHDKNDGTISVSTDCVIDMGPIATSKQQEQAQQTPIEQGIRGRVVMESGNQMPSPNAPKSSGKRGAQRTLYIYQLTNGTQTNTQEGVFHTNIQTNLVTQVVTDANGNFAVSLAPGRYSLFSKEDKGLYSNLFDGENNIFPVEVQQGQVTTVEFLINYNASY